MAKTNLKVDALRKGLSRKAAGAGAPFLSSTVWLVKLDDAYLSELKDLEITFEDYRELALVYTKRTAAIQTAKVLRAEVEGRVSAVRVTVKGYA